MITLKESTRWLTMVGRHDEAWESLKWIRADDSAEVQLEMEEIREGVAYELREREGFQLKGRPSVKHPHSLLISIHRTRRGSQELGSCFNSGHRLHRPTSHWRHCFVSEVLSVIDQSLTQSSAYYAPQYFKLLVGNKGNSDLLLTAIFGAIKVAACLTFVLFVAERVNRKKILVGGALFMAACQISAAAVVKTHPAHANGDVSSSGIATVALIYMFVIAYNFSWGPLPWPYVSEIFPTRIREPGIAVGVASQWLMNFVFTLGTPFMIKNMGWGTFLLWGVFDFVIAAGCFVLLKETRGLSLETIAETTHESAKLHDDLESPSYDRRKGQGVELPEDT